MCVSGCGKPCLLPADSSHPSNNEVHTSVPAHLTISRHGGTVLEDGQISHRDTHRCHSLPLRRV